MSFKEDVEKYTDIIRERLSEKRFNHSVNVSNEAVRLANLYGVDEQKAKIVGLLHDISKEAPEDDQKQFIKEHGEKLNKIEEVSPKLLHSISGMLFLRDVLKIEDVDMLNAVRYHTTAREEMSQLEKVLFVADFTSAERDYEGVDKIREMSNISLDKAMMCGLSLVIEEISRKQLPMAINTALAYNELALKKKEGII